MAKNERISQTDTMVEKLRSYFLSGEIKVGDKLPIEKELCELYGVGRSTLREAMRTLQVMGYVKVKPGSGTYLFAKKLDNFDASAVRWIAEHQPDVEEVVDVRTSLETLAIRLAAKNGSDSQLAEVNKARIAYEDALADLDYGALRGLDEAFHRAIVEASGSQLLMTLCNITAVAYRNWRDRSLHIKTHAANAVMFHQKIASHLMARDAELAGIEMRRHLEQVLIDMSEVMDIAKGT